MTKKVYEKAQVCCKNFDTGRIITNSSLLAEKMQKKESEYRKEAEKVQQEVSKCRS